MKLLLENWRKYLNEDEQLELFDGCKPIIAYHASNEKFDKFDMSFANPDDHAGKGIYFSTDLEEYSEYDPYSTIGNKYIYKVKLNICDGVRYPEEPNPEIHNHVYDIVDTRTIYRMLSDKDIEILEVIDNETLNGKLAEVYNRRLA